MSRRAKVRLLSLLIVLALWEYYGRRVNPILFTYPLAIARAFIDLVLSGELQSYMKDSLLVLLYASILSVIVGVFLRRRDGALCPGGMGDGYLCQCALLDADGGDGATDRALVRL